MWVAAIVEENIERIHLSFVNMIIHSISCELCHGNEGPALFGDEKDGYVLSYMFKIDDSQARGSQRSYSFIFLMTDRVYLVSSWAFLVR